MMVLMSVTPKVMGKLFLILASGDTVAEVLWTFNVSTREGDTSASCSSGLRRAQSKHSGLPVCGQPLYCSVVNSHSTPCPKPVSQSRDKLSSTFTLIPWQRSYKTYTFLRRVCSSSNPSNRVTIYEQKLWHCCDIDKSWAPEFNFWNKEFKWY